MQVADFSEKATAIRCAMLRNAVTLSEMTRPDVESAAADVAAGGSEESVADGNWRARLAGLWRLYRQSAPDTRAKLFGSFAMTLVATLWPLVLVFVAALLADRANATPGGGVVGWASRYSGDELAVFLGMVALVTAAAVYFEMTWFAELGSLAGVELRKRLFGTLISLPLGFFAGSRMKEVADMVDADLKKVQSSWCVDWRLLWSGFLLVAATTVALFVIEARLAGIVLGALAVIAGLVGWLLKTSISPRKVGSASRVFRESVQALPLVKSFANENHERGRLRYALSKASAAEQGRTRWRSGVLAVGGLLVTAVVIYYFWYRAQQIAKGDGSFEAGRTVAFVFLTVILAATSCRLVQVWLRLLQAGLAAQRAALILAENSEQLENGPYLPDSRGRLEGRVEFNKASVSAMGANGKGGAVTDFTMKMAPGQKIAVVGPDASGRALLLELMLGFHELDGGEIWIDGRSLSDYPLAWLRGQIGWLPREPQFFSATVAENIAFGRPGATEKEIREAAEKAAALDFIENLADGFGAKVAAGAGAGPRDGFSPNWDQRHRLALARVFLKDPPVVAIEGLDPGAMEPPGHGDGKAKAARDVFAQIAEAEDLLMKGRTALVVARRLSVTRDADLILVMRDGRVEEQGQHAELYESKGYYRLLCEGSFGRH
jgi:ABC-type multidrug transport system fused ATPase/permease subunit